MVFLGQRSDAERLYQAFDVFVLPSLYEGLTVVGIEAQATGNLCFFSDRMTEKTKVTDSVVFMSLDTPAAEWAERIADAAKTHEKRDTREELAKQGYDIKAEARRLEEYYLSLPKN